MTDILKWGALYQVRIFYFLISTFKYPPWRLEKDSFNQNICIKQKKEFPWLLVFLIKTSVRRVSAYHLIDVSIPDNHIF